MITVNIEIVKQVLKKHFMTQPTKMCNYRFPKDIAHDLKVYCAVKDTTQTELLIHLIVNELNKDKVKG